MIELNNYIDFIKLFNDLYIENEDKIIDDKIENECLGLLLQFNAIHKNIFELVVEESQFNDREIIFFFEHYNNDANESDTQGTSEYYYFVYDRNLEFFSDASYDQG